MSPVIDRQKLVLEFKKLEIEREKLAIERYKARLEASKTKWTAVSVAVPVVVAILTVAYGFWSTQDTARFQFQLEAAKSAMQAGTPVEANNRLVYYKKLFPDQLPNNFTTVNGELDSDFDREEATSKKEFFKSVIQMPGTKPQQALELWKTLFSADEWARRDELARVLGSFPVPSSVGDTSLNAGPINFGQQNATEGKEVK